MELIVDVRLLSPGEQKLARDWLVENNLRAKCRWPYLYEGDPHETKRVIDGYVNDPECIVAVAVDGGGNFVAVEMTNAMAALPDGVQAQIAPLVAKLGADPAETYWSNWLIVDPAHRGLGLGEKLMGLTLAELRRRGAQLWVFDVLYRRLPDHRAPPGYANDTSYYEKFGFARAPTPPLVMSWVDIGDDKPSAKAYMTYIKDLR